MPIAVEDWRPFIDCTHVDVKYGDTLPDYRERLLRRSSAATSRVVTTRLSLGATGLYFGMAIKRTDDRSSG